MGFSDALDRINRKGEAKALCAWGRDNAKWRLAVNFRWPIYVCMFALLYTRVGADHEVTAVSASDRALATERAAAQQEEEEEDLEVGQDGEDGEDSEEEEENDEFDGGGEQDGAGAVGIRWISRTGAAWRLMTRTWESGVMGERRGDTHFFCMKMIMRTAAPGPSPPPPACSAAA